MHGLVHNHTTIRIGPTTLCGHTHADLNGTQPFCEVQHELIDHISDIICMHYMYYIY